MKTNVGGADKILRIVAGIALLAFGSGAVRGSGGVREGSGDARVLEVVRAETNLTLFLEWHAVGVEKDGPRIRSVTARHVRTSAEHRFRARLFASDEAAAGMRAFLTRQPAPWVSAT